MKSKRFALIGSAAVVIAAAGLVLLILYTAGRKDTRHAEALTQSSVLNKPVSDHNAKPVLKSPVMRALPLGAIRPAGWLHSQLRIQADGLSGHLDEFWPDIKNSAWFGGEGDRWERAPYWLDGIVPLAFLLDDEGLKEKVKTYVHTILVQQDEDGMFGLLKDQKNYDLWAVFLVLKPLIQYWEATADPAVPQAVGKCLRWIDDHIDRSPLFNWGQFRWFEALLSIEWLYEQKPEQWLLDLAVKLEAQGFDWENFFTRWPLRKPTRKGHWTFMGHVVNNAMAVKAPALWWRLTGEDRDRQMADVMMAEQDRYHGLVTGIFSGDECLAGKDPSHGTELCSVVEYMYSLEVLLSVLGEPHFGDRLEKVAFNALPATFSPDMWAHQYDQQVNQAECSINPNRNWTTNGPESNLYGLEPNYGCCTANFSQGWPKFTSHLWMKTGDGGLAAVAYAPCIVQTKIGDVPVKIEVATEYPFREDVRVRMVPEKALRFPVHVRIPAWADGASLQIGEEKSILPAPGSFYVIKRMWKEPVEIHLHFPMKAKASRRYRNALAIERGPLVYSLKLGERWKRVNEDKPDREPPHADWEVYPTNAWNYALALDENSVKSLQFKEHPVGTVPFSPEGAPVSVKVKGILLDSWKMVNGSADPIPESPVSISGPKVDLILIPYGCTNIRITEFPTLK